jgi:hypothetical protein
LGDVDLRAEDTQLTMEVRGIWPRTMRMVPVSEQAAIVLYSEGGGTMLHRKGNELSWTNPSGRKFLMTRR